MTLTELQNIFPNTRENQASTGLIPISYFNENESEIRQVLRANNMRVYYRGPRPQSPARRSLYPTTTRRENAVSVVAYSK